MGEPVAAEVESRMPYRSFDVAVAVREGAQEYTLTPNESNLPQGVDIFTEGLMNVATLLRADTGYKTTGTREVYDIPWQTRQLYSLFVSPSEDAFKKATSIPAEAHVALKQIRVITLDKEFGDRTDHVGDRASIECDIEIEGKPTHVTIRLSQKAIHEESETHDLAQNTVQGFFDRTGELRRGVRMVSGLVVWDMSVELKDMSIPAPKRRLLRFGNT